MSDWNITQRLELLGVLPSVEIRQLSLGDLSPPNFPQLVLLKEVGHCKVLVLHELKAQGFYIYKLHNPVHQKWYLCET